MTRTFRKTGPEASLAMFEAEAAGLEALRDTGEIRVPEVLDFGIDRGNSFIVLEFLEFEPASGDSPRLIGQRLARLHRHTAARFGWHRDNTIGPTPQINTWNDDWVAFYREHRLEYQVRLARANGYDLSRAGTRLGRSLSGLFNGYAPAPSLLHGDLWSGNALPTTVAGGEPGIAVIDPACSIGDGWADIAMMRLFGGFPAECFRAYAECVDDRDRVEQRVAVYQLYHVLNHVNLFGRGYAAQAMGLARHLGC